MSRLQYFVEPIETKESNPVACPYIKIKNEWANTPVPHNTTLQGTSLLHNCVPNLNDRNPPLGFGTNICKSKPVHLSFNNNKEYDHECYSDNMCAHKIETCYDPILGI